MSLVTLTTEEEKHLPSSPISPSDRKKILLYEIVSLPET